MKKSSFYGYLFLNILITLTILLILAQQIGFIPFANKYGKSLLSVDLSQQYVDFFGLFKRAITQDPRLFIYSFQKGLGGEMVGLWAYYLMSPFNFIFLFFENNQFDLAVSYLILLKYLALASSFYYFAVKKYQLPGLLSILFAQVYAFMGYTIVYYLNIMWLDGLILLPFIALGLDRLINKRQAILYVLSLSLAMIVHYYIAYMICLFLAIYAIFVIYEDRDPVEFRQRLKDYLCFIKYSLVSVGLAAFLLLPTFLSTLASKSSQGDGQAPLKLEWVTKFSLVDLFSKIFIGAHNHQQLSVGSANIFVGLTIVVMVILYFLVKNISRREKLLSLTIITFFLASFSIELLDKIWHLGQFPIWYNSRFSFTFSFFLLILSMRLSKKNLKLQFSTCQLLMPLLILSGLTVAYYYGTDYDYLSPDKLFYSLLVIVLVIGLFMITKLPKAWRYSLLLLLCAGELGLNAYLTLDATENYLQPSRYKDYTTLLETMVFDFKPVKNQFYRLHKTYQRTKNEALSAAYPGLNHFGSTLEAATTRLYGYLGLANTSNSASYNSGSLFLDDFFDIHYLLDITSNTGIATPTGGFNLYRMATDKDIQAYEKVLKKMRYLVYENPDALGLAIEVSSHILNTSFKKHQPIANQEKLLALIDYDGSGQAYFQKKDFTKQDFINLEVSNKGDGDYFSYQKLDKNRTASLALYFDNLSDNPYYFTLPSQLSNKNVSLQLNSRDFEFYSPADARQIMPAAFNQENKDLLLRVNLKKDQLKANPVRLYEFDLERYQNLISSKKKQTFTIESFKENHVSGKIDYQQKEGYLLFTLPYDSNWQIKVDGKKTKAIPVLNNTLMAIPMKHGQHRVSLFYFPQSLIWGAGISLVTLAYFIWELNHRKVSKLAS